MGSLFLGKILLSLVGLALKRTASTKSVGSSKTTAETVVPHASAEVAAAVNIMTARSMAKQPTTLKRNDIRTIYERQKRIVTRQLDMPAHTPYVVARSTALGDFLGVEDWQALAKDRLGETKLLERLEMNFDNEVHERLQRAAQKAGFVNVRGQVKAGPKQVASYSDGAGHGVRIAINYLGESQIGVDLIGYEGGECESKREELLEAMAAEGITVRDIKTLPHHDPKGYQGRQETAHKRTRPRVHPIQHQQQKR